MLILPGYPIINWMKKLKWAASTVMFALCVLLLQFSGAAGKERGMERETAVFAGGCFWCIQSVFEGRPGIVSAVSGYSGGHVANPTYEEVSSGTTGHLEAVKIVFDPSVISYEALLDEFWKNIDPTQSDGQFADRGPQYRTAIFFVNEAQKKAAEKSRERLRSEGKFRGMPIVTEIRPAETFYPAEEYHQSYSSKNRSHYEQYKEGSGRGPFIRELWGK